VPAENDAEGLQEIALYLDYRLDESYTPKNISVRVGNSFTDMTEVHAQELEEPHGWTRIVLQTQSSLQGALPVPCNPLLESPVPGPAVPHFYGAFNFENAFNFFMSVPVLSRCLTEQCAHRR
jgi:Anaphase-promoting complex, subunit 10 (APC10)